MQDQQKYWVNKEIDEIYKSKWCTSVAPLSWSINSLMQKHEGKFYTDGPYQLLIVIPFEKFHKDDHDLQVWQGSHTMRQFLAKTINSDW